MFVSGCRAKGMESVQESRDIDVAVWDNRYSDFRSSRGRQPFLHIVWHAKYRFACRGQTTIAAFGPKELPDEVTP
jgi:hypothetical protein